MAASQTNTDALRLNTMGQTMLQNLLNSYDHWIFEGVSHEFALAQVLGATTAGPAVLAIFKAKTA